MLGGGRGERRQNNKKEEEEMIDRQNGENPLTVLERHRFGYPQTLLSGHWKMKEKIGKERQKYTPCRARRELAKERATL